MNTLREEIADVIAQLGVRLSEAKTRVAHMSEGFDFLGFRIQWKRKKGTDKRYVYVFIGDRPIRSLKDKIRVLTSRLSQQPPRDVLIRLNRRMPSADGVQLFNLGRVPTARYRYRGNKIPNPWTAANHA